MIKQLANNQIVIWQVDLNERMFLKYSSCFHVLSKDEKENATSFKIDHHRKYYILSRIILRLLLSNYTGVDSELIKFYKNKYGKPFIKLTSGIKFNISHSESKLVIVIATCEVGIDIEYINIDFNFRDILDITLSENEKVNIKKLPPNLQKRQFYMYWTKKEALLKALGVGINTDLNKLEIPNNIVDGKIINIYNGKKWAILPFNSFDKNYIGYVVYNHKNNKIIQYYNCNKFDLF